MIYMNSDYWKPIILNACEHYETPFYLFSQVPIGKKLDCISQAYGPLVSNWLSFKTLPLKSLLQWWVKTGLGVEVVSEYELLAAYEEGFPPNRIMVNGVAKNSWKESCWSDGLRVNFDSTTEIQSLSSVAKSKGWRVGIRFHPTIQNDPENQNYPDQFGIPADAFPYACDMLRERHITLDTVHIHLRSNVPNISYYRAAIEELRLSLRQANIEIKCLDLGGGLPVEDVRQRDPAWHSILSIEDLRNLIQSCQQQFPGVHEYILENGRFVLSGCGVLVLTVRDVKDIGGVRFLICDGGRTNNALPSDWEEHDINVLPTGTGTLVSTAICGPTCMAYDCISRLQLGSSVSVGDKVIWFNAGAYHLSWENRFSQPLARILWHDDHDNIVEVRPTETFSQWWGRWR
jgi:diaminopimelate decarboxylase